MSKKKQTQWILNSANDTYYTQEPKQKCKQKWYSWACIAAEALHYLRRYDKKAPPFFPLIKPRTPLKKLTRTQYMYGRKRYDLTYNTYNYLKRHERTRLYMDKNETKRKRVLEQLFQRVLPYEIKNHVNSKTMQQQPAFPYSAGTYTPQPQYHLQQQQHQQTPPVQYAQLQTQPIVQAIPAVQLNQLTTNLDNLTKRVNSCNQAVDTQKVDRQCRQINELESELTKIQKDLTDMKNKNEKMHDEFEQFKKQIDEAFDQNISEIKRYFKVIQKTYRDENYDRLSSQSSVSSVSKSSPPLPIPPKPPLSPPPPVPPTMPQPPKLNFGGAGDQEEQENKEFVFVKPSIENTKQTVQTPTFSFTTLQPVTETVHFETVQENVKPRLTTTEPINDETAKQIQSKIQKILNDIFTTRKNIVKPNVSMVTEKKTFEIPQTNTNTDTTKTVLNEEWTTDVTITAQIPSFTISSIPKTRPQLSTQKPVPPPAPVPPPLPVPTTSVILAPILPQQVQSSSTPQSSTPQDSRASTVNQIVQMPSEEKSTSTRTQSLSSSSKNRDSSYPIINVNVKQSENMRTQARKSSKKKRSKKKKNTSSKKRKTKRVFYFGNEGQEQQQEEVPKTAYGQSFTTQFFSDL